MDSPLLLNFGLSENNVFFSDAFAPVARKRVLVTYDRLDLWPGKSIDWRSRHAEMRERLIEQSDVIVGLSEGSISDVPGAHYVGHGCDDIWAEGTIDEVAEPADLAPIPRPRAIYVGSLSVRISVRALERVARSGVSLVLIGFDPDPDLQNLIVAYDNIHFLGARSPDRAAAYLMHSDIGLIPHTDDPFTHSMEPHKVYNYTCAGLPSVVLHCALPSGLTKSVEAVSSVDDFADAVTLAKQRGRLSPELVAAARSMTWKRVAERILKLVASA